MSIEYQQNGVLFRDVVSVQEAEALLEWLQKRPSAHVDLSACTHLHPANLQVLMAAQATISAWPAEHDLADWLQSVLSTGLNPVVPPNSTEESTD